MAREDIRWPRFCLELNFLSVASPGFMEYLCMGDESCFGKATPSSVTRAALYW
jgi:hypothetical protein